MANTREIIKHPPRYIASADPGDLGEMELSCTVRVLTADRAELWSGEIAHREAMVNDYANLLAQGLAAKIAAHQAKLAAVEAKVLADCGTADFSEAAELIWQQVEALLAGGAP